MKTEIDIFPGECADHPALAGINFCPLCILVQRNRYHEALDYLQNMADSSDEACLGHLDSGFVRDTVKAAFNPKP